MPRRADAHSPGGVGNLTHLERQGTVQVYMNPAPFTASGPPTDADSVTYSLPPGTEDEQGPSDGTRLRLLREMMSEAFLSLDAHGRIREVNSRAAALLGLPAEELQGQEPWVAEPALAGTSLHERLMAALTTREGGRFLAELPSRTWLDVNVQIVGEETWVLAADITRRQRAENEVARTEERFRQLGERFQVALDSAQMAVWETNLATGQVFRSEGHDRLYGYPRPLTEWTHERFIESLHPDDRMGVQTQLDDIFAGKADTYASTFRTAWPDGTWHWLTSRARVLRDATGKVVVIRGAILDITALKETEFALQEAVRTRDDFLSLASHELRTPLTSLRLQAQLLRRMGDSHPTETLSAPRVQEKLESTERQLRRLGALVDNLLDVSRIRTGKLDFQFTEGDLAAVVGDLVARFTDEARHTGVQLTASVEGPVVGRFDRLRLEQVVSNLLSNALRYGAGNPVRLSLTRHEDGVRLLVRDSGPGVPPGDRERIFERFTQGDNARRRGGMGLGLYIVRQIVEAHGGHIRVEDSPGGGATFVVDLPL
ncbi:PAS domain-containing sensor histidine kinase [Myxococcus stipitatus]|uniref:sensor histidine kinase n=1 Tax=Myxococcus stipitatus TaxID=83455 RepID=UPI0031450CEE